MSNLGQNTRNPSQPSYRHKNVTIRMKQFEYVCASSYAKFLPIPSNIIIKRQYKRRIYMCRRQEEERKSITIGNGLKGAKAEEKEKKSHTCTFWHLVLTRLITLQTKKKGVVRNFNDSIIPYYAYMGSSLAYINATEQQ